MDVPPLHSCRRLVDEIIADGFVTRNEPIDVKYDEEYVASTVNPFGLTVPWGSHGTMLPFSVQCVKGMTKTPTLYLMISFCLNVKIPLEVAHPRIVSRVSDIHCINDQIDNKSDEMFANLRFALRGDIWKAASIVS